MAGKKQEEPESDSQSQIEVWRRRWMGVDRSKIEEILSRLRGTSGSRTVDDAERRSQVYGAIVYMNQYYWGPGALFEHRMTDLPLLDLRGADLSDYDVSHINFQDVALDGCIFQRSILAHCDFSQSTLRHVDFSFSEGENLNFSGTTLFNCGFAAVIFPSAFFKDSVSVACDFSRGNLRRIRMDSSRVSECNFNEACLNYGSMISVKFYGCSGERMTASRSDFSESEMIECMMPGAVFKGSKFSGARFQRGDLSGAGFKGADLGAVKWQAPINVSRMCIGDANFANSREFERYIRDEQWLEEFKSRAAENWALKLWERIWLWSSDYGRSLWRMAAWVVLLVLLFAGLFHCANHGGFLPPGPSFLTIDVPAQKAVEILGSKEVRLGPFWESLQLSIDLFSTTGASRVEPRTILGTILMWAELALGWLTLGSLVSLLANFFARRA